MTDKVASKARENAQWAIEEGLGVLIWSARLQDAERGVQAIEELGWKIEHMAAFWNNSLPSRPEVVFLFRRPR